MSFEKWCILQTNWLVSRPRDEACSWLPLKSRDSQRRELITRRAHWGKRMSMNTKVMGSSCSDTGMEKHEHYRSHSCRGRRSSDLLVSATLSPSLQSRQYYSKISHCIHSHQFRDTDDPVVTDLCVPSDLSIIRHVPFSSRLLLKPFELLIFLHKWATWVGGAFGMFGQLRIFRCCLLSAILS